MKKIEDNEEFNNSNKETRYRYEDVMTFLTKMGFEPTGTVYISEHEIHSSQKNIDKLDLIVSDNSASHQLARINVNEFCYSVKIKDNMETFDDQWQDYLLDAFGNDYALRLYDYLTDKISIDESNVKSLTASYSKQLGEIEKQIESLGQERNKLQLIIESFDNQLSQDQKRLERLKDYMTRAKCNRNNRDIEF